MKKKEFKSESKRLLDLMINSIYTNKDIFLRELISNASDALDKLHYRSLTDDKIKINKDNLEISLSIDEKNRTITISDNGCGMTDVELENNLGTIAKSGSLSFKEMLEKKDDVNIIGQFGVGFYSAFMVSKKIEVLSKSVDSDKAYLWVSSGLDGYEIKESNKETVGTTITLYIKDDTDDDNYSEYLTECKIKSLVKKYSDYIRYPIKMEVTVKSHEKDKEDTKEIQTLNSMIPLWDKNKKDVSEDDYNNFYTNEYYDYEKPLKVIHSSVEGLCSYKSLLFIPSHAPFDFYTKEYEKGLSLYSNGVLIMDKCADLLPDYFSFVKGIVDTDDISLNISREMLQKTKQVQTIAKGIESKIKKELEDMLENDRELYTKFFKNFGIQLKFGVYNNYGMDKEKLQDLLLFSSSKSKNLITLKEYISNMKDSQTDIYYASGETYDKIDNLPQVEQVKEKDYEILYLTDYVDEFVINALMQYNGKNFVNVSNEKLDLDDDNKKEEIKKLNESNKDLLESMKKELNIADVKFTNKLKKHPVCLTTKGDISVEMENAFQKYTKILYSEARLIEGLPIENPTEISNLICEVISK